MKTSMLKLTVITLLAAAIVGLTCWSRAEDAASAPATPEKAAAEKFYGPVTAVDTNAMTFTVGDQTFNVTSQSKLTKDGKPATLSDAVVGEPARGSYTKSDDGKLNVTKARFGKKSAAGKSGGKSGGKKKKSGEDSETNAPAASGLNQ